MEDNELKPMEDLSENVESTTDYQTDYTEELDLGEINLASEDYIDSNVDSDSIEENQSVPVEEEITNEIDQQVEPISNSVESQEIEVESIPSQMVESSDQLTEIEPISETSEEVQPNYDSYVISEESVTPENNVEVEPISDSVEPQEQNFEDNQIESFDVKNMFEGVTVPDPEPVNVIPEDSNVKEEKTIAEQQPIIMAEHPNGKIKLNFDKEEQPKVEEDVKPSDIKIDIKGNKSLLYVVGLGLIILIAIFLLPFIA